MATKPDRTLAIVISVCTAVITLTLVTMIILFKPWADKDRQQETETEAVEENAVQHEEAVEEAAEGDSENEPPITEAEEEYFDWKTAYTDYITDNDLLSNKCALICLDEDKIPEIFINTGPTSSNLTVLTCYRGEVSMCDDLSSHSQYVPGEGFICSTTGQMGNYPLRIVKLQEGQFNEIATGLCEEELDFDNGTSTEHYYWGGYDKGEISAEEYNAHIAEYIDEEKSRTLSDDDFYLYDTLCDKLREWADEGGAGQNTQSTPRDAFLEYAKGLEYVSGRVGYFDSRFFRNEYDAPGYERIYAKVPFGNIDCFIEDYDKDGQDEMLIPVVENEKKFVLSMYEYKDEPVLSAQKDMSDYLFEDDDSDTFALSYDHNGQRYIGVVTVDCAYLMSDGTFLGYVVFVYDEQNGFVEKGHAGYAGSDGEEAPKFVRNMQDCGADVNWYNCFDGDFAYEVLSKTRGTRLFEIKAVTNDYVMDTRDYSDPAYTWYTKISGYVSYTGYSPFYFSKHDEKVP